MKTMYKKISIIILITVSIVGYFYGRNYYINTHLYDAQVEDINEKLDAQLGRITEYHINQMTIYQDVNFTDEPTIYIYTTYTFKLLSDGTSHTMNALSIYGQNQYDSALYREIDQDLWQTQFDDYNQFKTMHDPTRVYDAPRIDQILH